MRPRVLAVPGSEESPTALQEEPAMISLQAIGALFLAWIHWDAWGHHVARPVARRANLSRRNCVADADALRRVLLPLGFDVGDELAGLGHVVVLVDVMGGALLHKKAGVAVLVIARGYRPQIALAQQAE